LNRVSARRLKSQRPFNIPGSTLNALSFAIVAQGRAQSQAIEGNTLDNELKHGIMTR
jgi:hypothetical protein